jgi:hypothetical protein
VTCAIGMTCAIGILSFLSNASGMRATIGVWNRLALGFVSDFRFLRLDLVNHGSSTTTTEIIDFVDSEIVSRSLCLS